MAAGTPGWAAQSNVSSDATHFAILGYIKNGS